MQNNLMWHLGSTQNMHIVLQSGDAHSEREPSMHNFSKWVSHEQAVNTDVMRKLCDILSK